MAKVFKYGGHALPKNGEVDPTIDFLAKQIQAGERLILVHGGGPQINQELAVHGIESEMVNGFRKTTPEVFEVVQRTLSGEVLRTIVNGLIAAGVNAVGISAADGELIRAKVKDPALGLVGEIESVNPNLLLKLLESGYTPVVSPVGVNRAGEGLNLNADLVAGAIGGAVQAQCVYFATDVSGIYRNWPDEESMIDAISAGELSSLAKNFSGGMIPKAQAVLNAVNSGSKSARVFDGRDWKNVELALAGKVGTLVVA